MRSEARVKGDDDLFISEEVGNLMSEGNGIHGEEGAVDGVGIFGCACEGEMQAVVIDGAEAGEEGGAGLVGSEIDGRGEKIAEG